MCTKLWVFRQPTIFLRLIWVPISEELISTYRKEKPPKSLRMIIQLDFIFLLQRQYIKFVTFIKYLITEKFM